jgi:hypothetical protein
VSKRRSQPEATHAAARQRPGSGGPHPLLFLFSDHWGEITYAQSENLEGATGRRNVGTTVGLIGKELDGQFCDGKNYQDMATTFNDVNVDEVTRRVTNTKTHYNYSRDSWVEIAYHLWAHPDWQELWAYAASIHILGGEVG